MAEQCIIRQNKQDLGSGSETLSRQALNRECRHRFVRLLKRGINQLGELLAQFRTWVFVIFFDFFTLTLHHIQNCFRTDGARDLSGVMPAHSVTKNE